MRKQGVVNEGSNHCLGRLPLSWPHTDLHEGMGLEAQLGAVWDGKRDFTPFFNQELLADCTIRLLITEPSGGAKEGGNHGRGGGGGGHRQGAAEEEEDKQVAGPMKEEKRREEGLGKKGGVQQQQEEEQQQWQDREGATHGPAPGTGTLTDDISSSTGDNVGDKGESSHGGGGVAVRELHAHAIVLASRSKYFQKLFCEPYWKEARTKVVDITLRDQQELDDFCRLIKLSYGLTYGMEDQQALDTPTMIRLMLLADAFEVEDAILECSTILVGYESRRRLMSGAEGEEHRPSMEEAIMCIEALEPLATPARTNIKIIRLTAASCLAELLGRVEDWWEPCPATITTTHDIAEEEGGALAGFRLIEPIKSLSVVTFRALLESNRLDVSSEADVYWLLRSWVHAQPHRSGGDDGNDDDAAIPAGRGDDEGSTGSITARRQRLFNELVDAVHFHRIPCDYIGAVVAHCPYMHRSGKLTRVLQQVVCYQGIGRSLLGDFVFEHYKRDVGQSWDREFRELAPYESVEDHSRGWTVKCKVTEGELLRPLDNSNNTNKQGGGVVVMVVKPLGIVRGLPLRLVLRRTGHKECPPDTTTTTTTVRPSQSAISVDVPFVEMREGRALGKEAPGGILMRVDVRHAVTGAPVVERMLHFYSACEDTTLVSECHHHQQEQVEAEGVIGGDKGAWALLFGAPSSSSPSSSSSSSSAPVVVQQQQQQQPVNGHQEEGGEVTLWFRVDFPVVDQMGAYDRMYPEDWVHSEKQLSSFGVRALR